MQIATLLILAFKYRIGSPRLCETFYFALTNDNNIRRKEPTNIALGYDWNVYTWDNKIEQSRIIRYIIVFQSPLPCGDISKDILIFKYESKKRVK